MPSVSDKQRRFMAAASHDKAFAAKAGISQDVAQEFFDADQARKQGRDRITRAVMARQGDKKS